MTAPLTDSAATLTPGSHIAPAETTETVRAVGAGDRAAFAMLYQQLFPLVATTVRGIVRDRHITEEVTQEVFVQIWQQAHRFDPQRGHVVPWILTMTRRRAIDRVRSNESLRRQDSRFALVERDAEVDLVTEAVLQRADHQQIGRLLTELSDIQREAIHLSFFKGYSNAQASERLGIPLPTFKSRLRDALSKVRTALHDSASVDEQHPAACF